MTTPNSAKCCRVCVSSPTRPTTGPMTTPANVEALRQAADHPLVQILHDHVGLVEHQVAIGGQVHVLPGQLEVAHQRGRLLVHQLWRKDRQGDALAGVAEDLGAADDADAMVRIAQHGRLVGRLSRLEVVLPHIHAEVGEILDGDDAAHVGRVGGFGALLHQLETTTPESYRSLTQGLPAVAGIVIGSRPEGAMSPAISSAMARCISMVL